METSVDDLVLVFLSEGKPLEGEGGPFEFLNEEAIVEKACVFHPSGVVSLILLLVVHGANQNK